MLKSITPQGSKVVGPYSPAVETDNLIFISGQIGIDETGNLAGPRVEEQTKQALKNLQTVLKACKINKNQICKTTLFFQNIEDYTKVNKIYAEFFGSHKPARAAIEVAKLPKKAKIEIQAIATKQ
jgi:2-iminobutanoate/2-iminopropanoate deaminase